MTPAERAALSRVFELLLRAYGRTDKKKAAAAKPRPVDQPEVYSDGRLTR